MARERQVCQQACLTILRYRDTFGDMENPESENRDIERPIFGGIPTGTPAARAPTNAVEHRQCDTCVDYISTGTACRLRATARLATW